MKHLIKFIFTWLTLVVNSFVFMTLWRWFVAPLFEVPIIALADAMGLFVLIRFVVTVMLEVKKVEASKWEDEVISRTKMSVARALSVLFIGWLITFLS